MHSWSMASKKASSKGKRYTAEQKQEIIDFVNDHNSQNKRGGVTAAAKQFGVSQLTIGGWLKAGGSSKRSTNAKQRSTSTGDRGKILNELVKLEGEIAVRRKELTKIEEKFQKLKALL